MNLLAIEIHFVQHSHTHTVEDDHIVCSSSGVSTGGAGGTRPPVLGEEGTPMYLSLQISILNSQGHTFDRM
jgi:hypothetical protein